MTTQADQLEGLGTYKFGWSDSDEAGLTARRGIDESVVRNISDLKSEPQWMLDLRLKGLKLFGKKPMPTWGSDLSGIHFDNIKYFVRSTEKQATSWDDLPAANGQSVGEQLCQQHCPVSHVAHEFPQLCEAETEAIAAVLGTHVQRLATIAHGDGVCTTCIPSTPTREKVAQ